MDNSHSDNFFIFKNTSIQGQKVLNPFFCSSNCLVKLAAIYTFFIQFTQSAMFEKKLRIPAPYISDQFYNYRSDLPTLLSTFSKISQNFCHYPVFICTQSHVAFKQKNNEKSILFLFFCIFHWFGRRVGSRQRGCKYFSEFFQGGFYWGFFLLKRVGFRFIST